MRKKILILGAGPSQVDLIKICKSKQMITYACANDENGPGVDLVDEFRLIDIKDVSAVKSFAKEKEVDFVFTVASEVGIQTTSQVCEYLGLPSFLSSETAYLFRKKSLWRKKLINSEWNVPFMTGSKIRDLEKWTIYPAIIKPVDGSGQRGVYKVNDRFELEKYFSKALKFSKSTEIMVEKYIEGPEISVNAFIQNSRLVFMIVSDRISYTEYPGGIIKEHIIPSHSLKKNHEKELKELLIQTTKLLGLDNGHIYYQLKLNEGKLYIIEIAPRFDGCHMWRAIEAYTGVNLIEYSLKWLEKDGNVKFPEKTIRIPNNMIYKIKFISDEPGKIFNKNEYIIPDETIYLEWYYNENQVIKEVTGHIEKVGYLLVEQKI